MSDRNEFYDDQSIVAGDAYNRNLRKTEVPPEEDRFARTEPVILADSTVPMEDNKNDSDGKTEIADVLIVDGKRVAQTVGWLVCIKGACKGADFHLHSGFNYVGNNQELDICIQDPQVSHKAMVTIAFDSLDRTFTLMRCEGTTNIARCNKAPVYTPIVLHIYDIITLGSTELMFVPLCGDQFTWEEDK